MNSIEVRISKVSKVRNHQQKYHLAQDFATTEWMWAFTEL